MDWDDFATTTALHAACERQLAVATAAVALLGLMDRAGEFGAEGEFDDDRASVQATFHDVISARCDELGKLAHEAGFAIGAELRALGRQLNTSWCAAHEAAVRTRLLAAAE